MAASFISRAKMTANWTRLIRFTARETGKIHLGQPVDPNVDVGLALLNQAAKPLQAYEIAGSSPVDPNATVTSKVLTVSHLHEPLARETIKIVRCLGLNYIDHATEAAHLNGKSAEDVIPKLPILFYKPVTTLIPPNAPITIPHVAQPIEKHVPDFEGEFVIVIGRDAKDVSEQKALDYVLGYTAGNDTSFRFWQQAISQWGFSKSFDDTNPIGPCLVSTRVVPDPQTLGIKTTVNDVVMQNGSTAQHIFNVRKTVAFLSQGTTLEAGSIIMTGTPAGVGFVRKPPVILKNEDEVRIWIDGGIGTLVNKVIEGPAPSKQKL